MAYNDEAVRAKLSTLNETQESIVTVAQWIMFHRRHADRTATLWLERVKDSNASKRLNLIYLANEVVQQSKARKRDDFLIAFSPFVPEAVSTAFRGASADIRSKIRRVVEVWRQRNIFDESIQAAAETRMKELENTHSAGGKKLLGGSLFASNASTSFVAPTELRPLIPLQNAVSEAEAVLPDIILQAEGDAEDVTGTLDAAVPRRIARYNKALKSIASAESSIATVVRLRRDLLDELERLASSHRDTLLQNEAKLESLHSQAANISHLKQLDEDAIMRRLPPDEDELDQKRINGNGVSNPQEGEPAESNAEELTAPPVEDFTPVGSPEPDCSDQSQKLQASYAVRGRELVGQVDSDAGSDAPVLGADLLASLSRPYSTTDMASDETSVKKPRLHGSDVNANEHSTGHLADDLDDLIKSEAGRS